MSGADLRDFAALSAALDKAEAEYGCSLAPLREIAEILAASACVFAEVTLSRYGCASTYILAFHTQYAEGRFEVVHSANALTLYIFGGNHQDRFAFNYALSESDKCAAEIVSWYAQEEKYRWTAP